MRREGREKRGRRGKFIGKNEKRKRVLGLNSVGESDSYQLKSFGRSLLIVQSTERT